ncbi:MAG: hypothetical protein IKG23_13245 [Clostridia bacterium]|nr:hypothetical protein [Clostridia bacterium]
MLIIPYVCADFRDKKGNSIFRITADMLRTIQTVPDAIKQDLLFDMLVADGSIKTPETEAQKKLLEQEPMLEMGADGKTVKSEKPVKETKPKTENKADEKPAEAKPAEGNQPKPAK